MPSRNRRVLALATLLVGALLVPLTVTATGVSDALWAQTKTFPLGTVTLTAGEPDPEPEPLPTACPIGQVWDLFQGKCVTPGDPDSGAVDPTTWQCVDGTAPAGERIESIDETCFDPSDPLGGSSKDKCGVSGALKGRWTHYQSNGSPFTATDLKYKLTVAVPEEWLERATTPPFSSPKLLIRGREVEGVEDSNVWSGTFSPDPGPDEHTFLPEARVEPITISVSVTRGNGDGNVDKFAMWPAYLLVMVDITDDQGRVRRVSGVTTTKALHQGSFDLKCPNANGQGGTPFYTWTDDELKALGYGWPTPDGPATTH